MDKQFYVVVPFFPTIDIAKGGLVSSVTGMFKPTKVINLSEGQFGQYKQELAQRITQVASGLNQMGIRAIPLSTQELVEMYYGFYNPEVAANQKLIDAAQLQTATVTRGGTAPAASASIPPAVAPDVPVAPAPPSVTYPQSPNASPVVPPGGNENPLQTPPGGSQ
jgi:hypothetical protein